MFQEKLKKNSLKKIAALLLALSMLGSVAACSMPDAIFSGDGLVKESDGQSDDLADIFDFTFELNGETYELPLSYSALSARGWKIAEAQESSDEADPDAKVYGPETVMEPFEYSSYVPIEKKGQMISLRFYNDSRKERTLPECMAVGMRLGNDTATLPTFTMYGDITMGSRYENLANTFGKPSYIKRFGKTTGELISVNDVDYLDTEEDAITTLYYRLSDHSFFSFELGDYNDKSDSVVCVTIENDTPEEAEYDYTKEMKRLSDTVALYKNPSLLGKTFSDFAFKYEGNLYTLPIPVKEMVDDGWVIARGASRRIPCGTTASGFVMRRGNIAVDVLVHNYDLEYPRSPIHCYAVSLSAAVDSTNVALLLPKGVTIGSPERNLVAAFGKAYAAAHPVDEDEAEAETQPAAKPTVTTEADVFPLTDAENGIPEGTYIEKTVTEEFTVYSYVMPDDVPTVTLPVSVTDIGDTGVELLGENRKYIRVYVSNVNHMVVRVEMQNCPEYVVDENEIIEQQMEAARKQEEERKKAEAEAKKNG